MDTVARWACELFGFSGCNMLSPSDVALFAWATKMVGLIVAVLLIGFVLGRYSRKPKCLILCFIKRLTRFCADRRAPVGLFLGLEAGAIL